MTKKHFGCLLLVISLLLFCLIAFGGIVNLPRHAKVGRPLVEPSPETTVIALPLDENGDPDYVAYLNRRQKAGVTLENNAAIPMIQALGPKFDALFSTEPPSAEYFRELGIEPLEANSHYFVGFDTWIKSSTSRKGELSAEQWKELLSQQHDFVTGYPWTGEQFPEQQQWLEKNREPLELIRQATTRPRFYEPLLGESVVDIDSPIIFSLREIAESLSILAMNHLAEDRIDAALENTLAIRRLARLVDQAPSLVAGLLAISIDENGIGREWRIVQSGKATKQQLLDYLQISRQLASLSGFRDRYDNFERLMSLDAVFRIARGQSGDDWGPVKTQSYPGIDWKQALLEVNSYYDLLVKNETVAPEAKESGAELSEKYEALENELREPLLSLRIFVGGRKTKGRYLGKLIVALMPASLPLRYAAIRAQARRRLSLIVIAWETYKIDRGAYPETLDQLTPKYFEKLPLDPFVDKPFRYQQTDDGYLLYSLGKNAKDDGGMEDVDDWQNTDDLSTTWKFEDWNEIERELRDGWDEARRDPNESPVDESGDLIPVE
jgi:hypothetical protein